jgi:hypothetical protein
VWDDSSGKEGRKKEIEGVRARDDENSRGGTGGSSSSL